MRHDGMIALLLSSQSYSVQDYAKQNSPTNSIHSSINWSRHRQFRRPISFLFFVVWLSFVCVTIDQPLLCAVMNECTV